MKSDREAKKILKAFGKEAYKERIKYVDSFLPEKTSPASYSLVSAIVILLENSKAPAHCARALSAGFVLDWVSGL